MAYSIFVLAAAAAAQAAVPQAAPKWVPLPHANDATTQSAQRTAEEERAAGIAQAKQALNSQASSGDPVPAASPAMATDPAAGTQHSLTLTCVGAGTADKQRGGVLIGRWGWASAVSHHDRQFNDQVDVRLFAGDDRIRLPRTMLPGIHGGEAGWFKLKDVVSDSRSIQAHAAVSAFHNPKVYIDRTTGTISISGKDGDYSGECQVIDANAGPKF